MVYILGWVVFGFLLAVMVAISVATIWFSEEPSSKEAKVPEARALHKESKPHDVERKTAVRRAKTHH